MTDYTATLEFDAPDRTDDTADALIDALREHVTAVAHRPGSRLAAVLRYPAEDARRAVSLALLLADRAEHPLGALEVLPTADYETRAAQVPVPQLLSVTEAASAVGASRQAVLQRLEAGTLAGVRVGKAWAIPQQAVDAWAATRAQAASADR